MKNGESLKTRYVLFRHMDEDRKVGIFFFVLFLILSFTFGVLTFKMDVSQLSLGQSIFIKTNISFWYFLMISALTFVLLLRYKDNKEKKNIFFKKPKK